MAIKALTRIEAIDSWITKLQMERASLVEAGPVNREALIEELRRIEVELRRRNTIVQAEVDLLDRDAARYIDLYHRARPEVPLQLALEELFRHFRWISGNPHRR